MIPPLKKGYTSVVNLADPREATEIERVGEAGFKLKNHLMVYYWIERGKTWSSSTLDRCDENQTRFREAATGGEGKASHD